MSERLEPGSFFLGTTVDSDELMYRIRSKKGKDNTYSNDFMTIVLPQDSFDKDRNPSGLKYYFYLKEAIGKEIKIFGDKNNN